MADRDGLSSRSLFALIRRNALLIAVGTVLGALAGFVLTTINPAYGATVVVQVATGADAAQSSTLVESAASTLESQAIIEEAATKLDVTASELSQTVAADVQPGTDLIDLSAVSDSSEGAINAATEVVNVAISDYRTRSDQRAKQVRAAGADLLANGTLDETRAESARQASIGSVVGAAQGKAIQDTVTLSVASPALDSYRTGVSRPVGLILGAAAGALLTSLLALSQAWNRRRPINTLTDLEYAAAPNDTVVASAQNAPGLALTSGKKVVLVLGDAEPAREALARATAHGMTLNGTQTAMVAVIAGDQALHMLDEQRWEVGAEHISGVMSRTERRGLPNRLGVDGVVISTPLSADTSLYLAGQDDYLALVAIQRGTRVWRASEQLEQVANADPVAVLQP